MNRIPLTQCKNEAERQEHYPQICKFADLLQQTPNPEKVAKAALVVIKMREKEEEYDKTAEVQHAEP